MTDDHTFEGKGSGNVPKVHFHPGIGVHDPEKAIDELVDSPWEEIFAGANEVLVNNNSLHSCLALTVEMSVSQQPYSVCYIVTREAEGMYAIEIRNSEENKLKKIGGIGQMAFHLDDVRGVGQEEFGKIMGSIHLLVQAMLDGFSTSAGVIKLVGQMSNQLTAKPGGEDGIRG